VEHNPSSEVVPAAIHSQPGQFLNDAHRAAQVPHRGLQSWGYDRYGNRLNQTVTAGSGYSNTLGFANPGGAQTNHPDGMCFDSSGNMTAESGSCPPTSPMYSYDAENRMTAYSGTSAASYVYDDNGNRVKKCLPNCTSPTTTTVYVFSAGKDVAEYDNGAAPASPSREYIYSGGQLITTLAGSTTTYHHADHLSVRVSTDTNGNKIGEQGHYPYGESWYSNNTTTKFVFTGYERDTESNNDYAMARYYRVGFGRFCSPDPLGGNPGDPQSWNRYVYARDNPINNVDPSGMSWLSSFINALVSIFSGVNFGDMRTPPTFPTGNYDVWQKLEDAIIPPMGGQWIIMNAMPGATLKTDCGTLTKNVGLPGLTYQNALRLWNDLAHTKGKDDPTVAALGAVTWQGEDSSFSPTPKNNVNHNGSIDYGPFQLNDTTGPPVPASQRSAVYGTNGGGEPFNGDPDANITRGLKYLGGLYNRYGTDAAGMYTAPKYRQARQDTFDKYANKLQGLFSNTDCFPNH
jgi:RHS repeat-associated protein